jgi:hypothetical protein
MTVHFLQDKLTQQVKAPALKHGRTRWAAPTYQHQSAPLGHGSRKYGRNYSKVIGNPRLRAAGADVIWNAV